MKTLLKEVNSARSETRQANNCGQCLWCHNSYIREEKVTLLLSHNPAVLLSGKLLQSC